MLPVEALADLRHAADAFVMQLHQYAELRHRKPGGLGEARPAAHRAVHEHVHPAAQGLGEGGGFGHK